MRILIVDDDREIVSSLQLALKRRFAVDVALSAHHAEHQVSTVEYDVILLDYNLPDPVGPMLCQKWRQAGVTTPIIMLTGRDEVKDKVLSFESGVDDYLTKPFHMEELLMRLRSVLRRYQAALATSPNITVGDITMNLNTRIVTRQGKRLHLRRKEFQLLEYLIRYRGRVVTREMILEHIWDSTKNPAITTVDVHVKYLRDHLDRPFAKKYIRSVYGIGYKFEL